MDRMIPFESIFMKAMDQSRAIDSNVQVPFHPGLYIDQSQPEGNVGRSQAMNTEYLDLGARDSMRRRNLDGMHGGEGGAVRAMPYYTPGSGKGYTYPSEPEQATETMNLSPVHVEGTNTEQAATQQGGMDEQRNAIEHVAQYGDIPQLLAALKAMASMEPGQQGNPVFQLDDIYKKSSALGGIPGTVAQYPKAGGMTRETEYFF